MKLGDALRDSTAHPPKGTAGEESDWLDFCDLDLKSGRLLVVDASFAPSEEDGLIVDLPSGRYRVQARVMDYGTDRRVSRLRVIGDGEGSFPRGAQIGTTFTDTGRTGVCDLETFGDACGGSVDRAYEVIGETLDQAGTHDIAVLDRDAGAVLPFVSSGFGDGEFPVFELMTDASDRAGVEIEFIRPGEPYPFGRRWVRTPTAFLYLLLTCVYYVILFSVVGGATPGWLIAVLGSLPFVVLWLYLVRGG